MMCFSALRGTIRAAAPGHGKVALGAKKVALGRAPPSGPALVQVHATFYIFYGVGWGAGALRHPQNHLKHYVFRML